MRRQRYVVEGDVNSQNLFGATLTTRYHCNLRYSGHGEAIDPRNWELIDLELFPR